MSEENSENIVCINCGNRLPSIDTECPFCQTTEIITIQPMKKIPGECGSVVNADLANDIIKVKMNIPVEKVRIGNPYIIEGETLDFYTVLCNIKHDSQPIVMTVANSLDLKARIPHTHDDAGDLQPYQFPSIMELSCLKIMDKENDGSLGFKTIPPIFSKCRTANQDDIKRMSRSIINLNDTSGSIGYFLGTKFKMPLNFTELLRVPFGVFGKTGFGKTITMKTILISSLVQETMIDSRPVRFMIFDAMGEYSRGIGASNNLGLFQYIPDKLFQLSIDPMSTTPACTHSLYIDPSELTVDDWLNAFWDYTGNMEVLLKDMEMERKQDLKKNGKNKENCDLASYCNQFTTTYKEYPQYTVNALWRRMRKFNDPSFRSFLQEPPKGNFHVIKEVESLLNTDKSIIIHFGKYGLDPSIYMFVTNYLTKRLYEKYSLSISDPASKLPHLVLIVEEAHKFIPSGGNDIIGSEYFHKISRETRKVHLTAGFVDQRPSQLNTEVISQLGSRFVHRIDDPDDLKSALAGLDKQKWSPLVSKLSRGELITFGNVVGDIPTLINPFWSSKIQDIRDFFNITTITPDILFNQPPPTPKQDTIKKNDDDDGLDKDFEEIDALLSKSKTKNPTPKKSPRASKKQQLLPITTQESAPDATQQKEEETIEPKSDMVPTKTKKQTSQNKIEIKLDLDKTDDMNFDIDNFEDS